MLYLQVRSLIYYVQLEHSDGRTLQVANEKAEDDQKTVSNILQNS